MMNSCFFNTSIVIESYSIIYWNIKLSKEMIKSYIILMICHLSISKKVKCPQKWMFAIVVAWSNSIVMKNRSWFFNHLSKEEKCTKIVTSAHIFVHSMYFFVNHPHVKLFENRVMEYTHDIKSKLYIYIENRFYCLFHFFIDIIRVIR